MTTREKEYNHKLDIVNSFMEESGFRNYCKTKCKGRCCNNLSKPCGKKCTESLDCVAFICEAAARELLPFNLQHKWSGVAHSHHPTQHGLGNWGCGIPKKYVESPVDPEPLLEKMKYYINPETIKFLPNTLY